MELRAACIKTRTPAPLVEFYSRVFGREPEVDGGVDYRFYDFRLVVFHLTEEVPETKNLALIYDVEDVDGEYARLQALGLCNMGEPTDKPWGLRSFLISDPLGNTLSFVQELQ